MAWIGAESEYIEFVGYDFVQWFDGSFFDYYNSGISKLKKNFSKKFANTLKSCL